MRIPARLMVFLSCLSAAVLSGCLVADTRPLALDKAQHPDARGARSTTAQIDLSGMDRAVAPGDDFYGYANGGWVKTHEIPPDRSSYGPLSALYELTAKRTVALIQEAAAKAPPGSEAQKIGDYYASYLDEAGIEQKGLAPLRPSLDAIAAIADRTGLARALGASLRADVDVFNNTNLQTDNLFGLWVAQDLDEPTRYAPFLLQGGLGMPDRDYYLDGSARMAEIREKYQAHVTTMLKLAGLSDAEARAARIVVLERRIAEVHASIVDTHDARKGNNHWPRKDFEARAPGMDWGAFFGAASLDRQASFVVWQPNALIGIAALVGSQPLDTWKDWLTLHTLEWAAEYLPHAFVAESFAFHRGVLWGTPKIRERWRRAVDDTSEALGEPVGKLYVARWFPPSEKVRAEAMVRSEIEAFGRRIDRLDWMAPATKERAKAKLRTLKVSVGYPDRWRDYAGLEVVRGDALGNADRAARFEYRRNVAKLGQPVDRGEWVMSPQLVNAVNLPAMNALNFPAAMLQPPFFDPTRPAPMDYGAMGAIIGHEISHSFDNEGALFDAEGRLANWWTAEDLAHFNGAAAKLVRQFDGYRPFPDLAVNGIQTLGENMADLAGLAVAYDAYRISLGGREAPPVEGLSGDQQFFLAYGQSWCTKLREAAVRGRVLNDTHALPEYRAATVRNLDAWYAAFGAVQGQRLYLAPGDRVRIW